MFLVVLLCLDFVCFCWLELLGLCLTVGLRFSYLLAAFDLLIVLLASLVS